MAGEKVGLDQATLNALASMLGNGSKDNQQRQMFRREPMKTRASDQAKPNTGSKAYKEILDSEKELRKLSSEREARTEKFLSHEERSKARQLKIEKERSKWQDAYNKTDEKAGKKAEARIKKLEVMQKKADKNHENYIKRTQKTLAKEDKANLDRQKHQKTLERHTRLTERFANTKARMSGASSAAERLGGPVGSITSGIKAYRASRNGPGGKTGAMASGLNAASGGGGGIFSDMLSAAGTGAQLGGAFGPVGGIVGAIGGGALSLGKKALEAGEESGDKILKLSGNYLKAANQIPNSIDGATDALKQFGSEFGDAYVGALKITKRFGAEQNDVFETQLRITKAISSLGGNVAKVSGQMTADVYKFSTALNVPAEVIENALVTNMIALGRTGTQTSKDLGEMYSTVTAANSVFAKSLGGSKIKMDALSNIVFESARRADVWNLNYKEVTKQLVVMGAAAAKAGFSEERRQKMMKGTVDLLQDQSDLYSNIRIGQREYAKDLESIKDVKGTEARMKLIVAKYGEQGARARLTQLERAERNGGKMTDLEAGRYGAGAIGGQGGARLKLESIRQDYLGKMGQGDENRESRLQMLKKLMGSGGEELEKSGLLDTFFDEFEKGSEDALNQLAAAASKQEKEVKVGQPVGAGLVEGAAMGLTEARKNAAMSKVELRKVTELATTGMWTLVESMRLFSGGLKSASEQMKDIKRTLAVPSGLAQVTTSKVMQEQQRKQFEIDHPDLSKEDIQGIYAEREKERSVKAADILSNARNKQDFLAKSELRGQLNYDPEQIKNILAARKTSDAALTPEEIAKIAMPAKPEALNGQLGPLKSIQQPAPPTNFAQTAKVVGVSGTGDKGQVTVETTTYPVPLNYTPDQRTLAKQSGEAAVKGAFAAPQQEAP